MNSILRLTTAVNKVNCANPRDCLEEIRQVLDELAAGGGFDVAVFPKLALCSPSCGNFFSNKGFLESCEDAMEELAGLTRELEGYVIVGVAMDDWGRAVSAMAVLHSGSLVALIPTLDNDGSSPFLSTGLSGNYMPVDTVFACGSLRFCIIGCHLDNLPLRAAQIAQTGCDLLIVPAYDPVYAGYIEEVRDTVRMVSKSNGCALAVVNGGVGDTSAPYLYQGFAAICECGREMAFEIGEHQSFFCTADLDADVIRAEKKASSFLTPLHSIQPSHSRPGLLRRVDPTPFLPSQGRAAYLEGLFSAQVRSLTARMENIGISKLVLGVSGGLDSTAALLACAAAMDSLELPRGNIIGVTMPGLGTSDRTYYNALSLLEQLEVSRRDISIRPAVQQHFEDIGHNGTRDTTYENAQARERAQILLDIANMVSGIVVGTGDLSEIALGFCTFAGDHISNYNVNSSITKTALRELVLHLADIDRIPGANEVLRDILDTPISPELLPPGEGGVIDQKTEEILGPYELHDFFLYYFLQYRLRPSKIYYYACVAFAGRMEPPYILAKLQLFLKRFCAGQFKRSCAPDCASITEVNLCAVNYTIPSDMDPSSLLADLAEVDRL